MILSVTCFPASPAREKTALPSSKVSAHCRTTLALLLPLGTVNSVRPSCTLTRSAPSPEIENGILISSGALNFVPEYAPVSVMPSVAFPHEFSSTLEELNWTE